MRTKHSSSRLCTGHRAGRSVEPDYVVVKCPRCGQAYRVVEHAVWFCACEPCGIIFDGETGKVTLDRNEGSDDDNRQ